MHDGLPTRQEALRKYQKREPLTPDEERLCREYYRDRRRLRQEVYWPTVEDREAVRAEARRRGVNASEFVVEMCCRGLRSDHRTQDEWELLEEERDRATSRFEDALQISADLVRRKLDLQAQLEQAREQVFLAHERLAAAQERAGVGSRRAPGSSP